jgi:hypothetical protein
MEAKSLVTEHLENRKGGESMKTKKNDLIMQNKIFYWIAVATGLILLIPLIAMQVTREVNWDLTDFIVMGALIFGMGSIFVLIARKTNKKHRVAIAIACAVALLWIWVELAVGLFTNWGS